ncbi:hypothetical protein QYE76_012766 [Lolium multiflorum]|uniref:Uncharacterized protein n=1 Tax=Lolium multiflorum TaxID=4521 RepID=A0AAD8U1K0_LOLMU|nr:hypothetical protein QYE76_012766 [Lolium multiflorum]
MGARRGHRQAGTLYEPDGPNLGREAKMGSTGQNGRQKPNPVPAPSPRCESGAPAPREDENFGRGSHLSLTLGVARDILPSRRLAGNSPATVPRGKVFRHGAARDVSRLAGGLYYPSSPPLLQKP